MESSVVTSLFLPLALAIIMLGMGLNLSLKDFHLAFEQPRLIIIGLITQFIAMPLIAWLIALASGLSPELSVGLILIASCPIGTIANFMVHISRGDSAYSISLTAISSFLSVLSIPFIINLASMYFMEKEAIVQLPILSTILQVFAMIILPVGIGILIKIYAPRVAARLDRPLRAVSLLFLIVIVAGAIFKERANILSFLIRAGAATFALNCAAMLLGVFVAKLFIAERAIGRALLISTGMRNGTLAIAIASSPTLLNNPTMAIPAAIYSLSMFITVAAVVGWLKYSESHRRGALERSAA